MQPRLEQKYRLWDGGVIVARLPVEHTARGQNPFIPPMRYAKAVLQFENYPFVTDLPEEPEVVHEISLGPTIWIDPERRQALMARRAERERIEDQFIETRRKAQGWRQVSELEYKKFLADRPHLSHRMNDTNTLYDEGAKCLPSQERDVAYIAYHIAYDAQSYPTEIAPPDFWINPLRSPI